MSNYTEEDVDRKLEELRSIDEISDRNKDLLKEFIYYLSASDTTSPDREYKYCYLFKSLLTSNNKTGEPFITFDLDTASKKQMMYAVRKIKSSEYSDWSKSDFLTAIRRLLTTLYEDKKERPDNIRRILDAEYMKKRGSKIERKREIEVLEPEEVLRISEEATNPRDRLLPLFLYETGARIGEVLSIKVGDVKMHQKYGEVKIKTLKNNKGPRVIVLTQCVGILRDWLETHPNPEVDSHLFSNISRRGGNGGKRGKQMTNANVYKTLKKLGEEAGVDKRTNPHTYRHSAATRDGKTFGVSRLMHKYGWLDPGTARSYLHENDERMKEVALAEAGIEQEENSTSCLDRRLCSRCEETFPPTTRFCPQCSLALTQDAGEEARERNEAIETIADLIIQGERRPEEIEEVVRQVVSQAS